MSSKMIFNSADLKELSNKLKEKNDAIYQLYSKNIKEVLESSRQCFYVSGLDSDKIISSFNDIYGGLNNQISELVNLLDQEIIPRYDELKLAISKMFNDNFSSQMEALLPGVIKR